MKTRRTEYVVKRDCVSRIVTLPDGMARRTTLSLEENVELVADCDRFKLLTHSNGELEESDFEAFGAQCGKFTKTICGICHDRFIIVDQKEIFWTGASLKDAGRLTFAAAKMGAEIIPGLLESIRKATSDCKEYTKNSAFLPRRFGRLSISAIFFAIRRRLAD